MRAKVSGIVPFKLISARGRQILTDIRISNALLTSEVIVEF